MKKSTLFYKKIIVGFFLLIERWEIMKKNQMFVTYGLILSLFLDSFNFFWNLNMCVWLGFFYFCTPGINEKMLPNFGKEIRVLVCVF